MQQSKYHFDDEYLENEAEFKRIVADIHDARSLANDQGDEARSYYLSEINV